MSRARTKIALFAQAAGGTVPLPPSVFTPLLQARAKAGLGKAAERSATLPTPAVAASTPARDAGDLEAIIREEIVRALRKNQ